MLNEGAGNLGELLEPVDAGVEPGAGPSRGAAPKCLIPLGHDARIDVDARAALRSTTEASGTRSILEVRNG